MTFEVNAVKLTISVLIFISGLFGVLSPRLFNPFGTKISYANLISCGVLISAGLVHLLGDATEALNDSPLPKLEGGTDYIFHIFFVHYPLIYDSKNGSNIPTQTTYSICSFRHISCIL